MDEWFKSDKPDVIGLCLIVGGLWIVIGGLSYEVIRSGVATEGWFLIQKLFQAATFS
jgi:hypothetical protein